MTEDRQIPNHVFSELLFFQRLERTIRREQDRVYALLQEQMELLRQRMKLLDEVHRSVMERGSEEETPAPEIAVAPVPEETPDGE